MQRSHKKTPIVILNGFLGSGKTTLFRHLLMQAKRDGVSVCAIVNDMSETDIDGELISNTDMVEDNPVIFESIHDCVLSSQTGIKRLDQALNTLVSQQDPELIIIETSGSCHPLPLVELLKTKSNLQLTGLLTLVDSLMLAHDYSHGEQVIPLLQNNLQNNRRDTTNLLVEQILFCSHLILTKADRIEKGKLQDIAQTMQSINPYVSIRSVFFGKLAIGDILDMPEYDFHRVEQLIHELKPELNADAHNDRPYNLATRVIKDDRPFHPQRLWTACHEYLDQKIYRSKGFFWLATRGDLSLLWNQAAGGINLEVMGFWRHGVLEDSNNGLTEMELEVLRERLANEPGRFGDRHCNLTIIGDQDHVDQFTHALTSCFLTDDEIQYWQAGGEFSDPWPQNIVKLTDG